MPHSGYALAQAHKEAQGNGLCFSKDSDFAYMYTYSWAHSDNKTLKNQGKYLVFLCIIPLLCTASFLLFNQHIGLKKKWKT